MRRSRVTSKKILALAILVLMSVSIVSAESYEYLQSTDSVIFKSTLETSTLPFQEYDSYEICLDKLQEQEEASMAILDIGCVDILPHSIISYLTNSNNQIIISSPAPSLEELAAVENLKTQLNIQGSEDADSILFIKNYADFPENYNLNSGEYLFKVFEADDQYYIIIIGHTPTDTINAINKLIGIHDQYFKDSDCVILPDCSLEQHVVAGEPALIDVLITAKKFINQKTTRFSLLEIIFSWFS